MIITVGGSIGSGKSTLAKMLAEKYKLKYYSIGGIMRALAKDKGISLLELSELAETDPSVDRELDQKQRDLAIGDCIIDSRLGAYFIDADFKIWLDASPEARAQRLAKRDGTSVEKAREAMEKRRKSEIKRYKGVYNIDLNDKSVYDLVLDTTNLTPQETLESCIKALKDRGL